MTEARYVRPDAEPEGGLDARFCEVMDAAPVMIWVSGIDGLCVWFNRPWLAFRGHSIAQEFGNGWTEGVHPDDFVTCLDTYVRHFDARREFHMQYRLRRHDGAYRWIDDTGIPRHARDGTFLGYIGSCTDIHEQRETQSELRRRLLEIAHLTRRADAAALAASIAEKLNQPLAAILSNAEAAELYLKATPPQLDVVAEILSDICDEDHRAAAVMRHLRDLLGKNDAELQRVDLNDVVRAVHEILAPQAADMGVEVVVDQREHRLPVRADPVHLRQVVLSLALNGMDAMRGKLPGQRRMMFQTGKAGEQTAAVSVADSGTGIPADQLATIFDPFFVSTQRASGLGLSTSRGIIEGFGGKIWAENRTDGGAVFHFTLPLAEGSHA